MRAPVLSIAISITYLTIAVAGDGRAQARWQAFPPAQSSLVLSVPDLPELPSSAEELQGGDPATRTFLYTWGLPGAPAAYARTIVSQIVQTDKFFVRPPDYPQLLRSAFADIGNANAAFGADEQQAMAALGGLKYRGLSFGGRACLAFGSLFGVVPGGTAVTFQGGSAPKGDKWLYGYYCPPLGQVLTAEGARYILEGFGWKGIGTAKADRPKPTAITTRN